MSHFPAENFVVYQGDHVAGHLCKSIISPYFGLKKCKVRCEEEEVRRDGLTLYAGK